MRYLLCILFALVLCSCQFHWISVPNDGSLLPTVTPDPRLPPIDIEPKVAPNG